MGIESVDRASIIDMMKKAVELCLTIEEAGSVTVPDESCEFRVKASKRIYKKTEFYGEIVVTIGKPSYGEKKRIENIKKNNGGKIPNGYFVTIKKTLLK